jgi:hypothetical protein
MQNQLHLSYFLYSATGMLTQPGGQSTRESCVLKEQLPCKLVALISGAQGNIRFCFSDGSIVENLFEDVCSTFWGPIGSLVRSAGLRWPEVTQFRMISHYHLGLTLLQRESSGRAEKEKEGASVVVLGIAFRNRERPSI